jgi:hypothetical protein
VAPGAPRQLRACGTQELYGPDLGGRRRADQLAALVPAAGWQQMSCGDGAEEPRFYDWALIATDSPARHLLIRRPAGGGELAFFTCHAPAGTTLAALVRAAGARRAVEECFQAAKNETGLDHYQVRRYDAWYRHATLSMLALAFLQVTAAQKATSTCGQLSRTPRQHDHHRRVRRDDLTAVAVGEIRRMLAIVLQPQLPDEHYHRWSRWRRRHQARARESHYQRRRAVRLRP